MKRSFWDKEREYRLDDTFKYEAFEGEKLVSSNKDSSHMVKHIYHTIKNIEKLKPGINKKYQINRDFECAVLRDYLKKHGIKYTMSVFNPQGYEICNSQYGKKESECLVYLMRNECDEFSKVYRKYSFYINVCKDSTRILS
jgi:hypothetical protein